MPHDHLVAVGASFKTASLALRERFAIGSDAASDTLHYLKEFAQEVLILSTCNRSEVYLVGSDVEQARYGAIGLFSARSGLSPSELASAVYVLTEEAAVRHLLEVAAGMDSLVPGEHEILAQVRKAGQIAQENKSLGPILARLCQSALRAGKRARAETAIGRHPASVSLAAVRLAQGVCGPLNEKTALVLGAGKTASLVAQALKDQKIGCVLSASRTFAKAQDLARRVDGQAWPMRAVSDLLPRVDLLFSCTSAPDVVLTAAQVAAAQAQRKGRPLLLVDLAVPRDIDPQTRELLGVTLYDMDDLRAICNQNQDTRRRALADVEAIVREEAEDFCVWWQERDVTPTLVMLRSWAEAIRQGEMQKTLRKLPHLTQEEQQALHAMTEAIVNKMLHAPTRSVKAAGPVGAARVVHDIFGLPPVIGGLDGQVHDLLEFSSERVSHG